MCAVCPFHRRMDPATEKHTRTLREASSQPPDRTGMSASAGGDPDLTHVSIPESDVGDGRRESSRTFDDLYEQEFSSVAKSCWLICRDRAVAEDATQEAFARCFERWGRLHDKPWVTGWVARTAMNFTRRALKGRPVLIPDEYDAHVSYDIDASLDLERGLTRLPRRQQEVFVLYYITDLPIADVARAMRCREGTAKSHLFRARSAMQRYLKGEEDG